MTRGAGVQGVPGYGQHPPGPQADDQRRQDEDLWQELTSKDPHPEGWESTLLHKENPSMQALFM